MLLYARGLPAVTLEPAGLAGAGNGGGGEGGSAWLLVGNGVVIAEQFLKNLTIYQNLSTLTTNRPLHDTLPSYKVC